MEKTQRIRDYVHKLIVFDKDDDTDCIAWDLINTREFQRLRRIRQLGFSEFAFPGATHTRFSHCIGVYHTARQLLEVLKRKSKEPYDLDRARVAAIAALLHDIGHGPFSHVFERVESALGRKQRHETWSGNIVRGDTEISHILEEARRGLGGEVATLLTGTDPQDVYSSVVSSQFDADRLDYLRRDRYMTGTGAGQFDYEWLVDCLEVEKITLGLPGDEAVEVDGFVLNHKGLKAAEGYLLARFHLYSQVYTHKTTRSAETMLEALLKRAAQSVRKGDWDACGLPQSHPLVGYWKEETASSEQYLSLDDAQIWSAVGMMRFGHDSTISDLAGRLLDRRLFKCLDVGVLSRGPGGDVRQRFRKRIKESFPEDAFQDKVLIDDKARISAYGWYEWDEQALHKVLVQRPHMPGHPEDIAEVSSVVKSLSEERIFRVYAPEGETFNQVKSVWNEVAK